MTLDDLRKIAEAATKGPWAVEQEIEETDFGKFEIFSVDPVTAFSWNADDTPAHTALDPLEEADAEFIATFNPKRVLELLDENERLRDQLAERERGVAGERDRVRVLHARLNAVEQLHQPVEIEPSDSICGHCSFQLPNGKYFGKVVEWPCDTIKAARGE